MAPEVKKYISKIIPYAGGKPVEEVQREYGLEIIPNAKSLTPNAYSAVVLAVAHNQFKEMGAEMIRELMKPDGILYDIKYVWPKDAVDGRL